METRNEKGFTLIELLIVVAIIGILAAIAIPNLMTTQRRAKYSKAATAVKTGVTQAIVYGNDHNQYPTSLAVLRLNGYTNVSSTDPWDEAYQLSATLTGGGTPGVNDDVYIFSKGSSKSGTYPSPFTIDTGLGGSVGFSSVYGYWTGN